MDDRDALEAAIRLAADALSDDEGGPFGAVVVRDGRILGAGRNRVLGTGDPTAHAEVEAIRAACRALGSHDLSGATLYASCEPCPMCQGAAQWARVARVVYAASREDAATAGFDDARFHAGAAPPRVRRVDCAEAARDLMRRWAARPDRRTY